MTASPQSAEGSATAAGLTRAAVVGLGYVGLPTALGFTEAGWDVLGVDTSDQRVSEIRAGRADLLPTDHDRLAADLDTRLFLTTDPGPLSGVDLVVICVPTPVDEHAVPDLDPLRSACATVAGNATPGQILVLTSTSYIGSTRDLLLPLLRARGLTPGVDVHVAYSPERLDPGDATHVPRSTPRVVGGVTPRCARLAADALAASASVVHTVSSLEAAEATKLLENTYRAVNIAFANEYSSAMREQDLDPEEIIAAAATKPYGFTAFRPGPGVGGHCIPCDPHYLLWDLRRRRIPAPLIEHSMTAIAQRPRTVVERARELLADTGTALRHARVLLVGVAYKPGVADVRNSPAVEIIRYLRAEGAEVSFTDPLVDRLPTGTGVLSTEASEGAWDLAIVHTAHPGHDLSWLATVPLVLDTTYRLDLPGRHPL
ncbi:nucleotide sugar dehydrogenase [Saccharomonospora halophila]|uniref:nucleotide sugar dehydrogenase n=1 Tax=Saccharomonospora halophila TaxID=129922 RepID=UPI0003A64C78|nr:nucleotide sugar dehydrogenase [Saccharomonospora halophila]